MDVSLSFSLRWAAVLCQDITSLVVKHLSKKRLDVLNYLDDFGGVDPSKAKATDHFTKLRETLYCFV